MSGAVTVSPFGVTAKKRIRSRPRSETTAGSSSNGAFLPTVEGTELVKRAEAGAHGYADPPLPRERLAELLL